MPDKNPKKLVHPAEADIKPSAVDPRTGRTINKTYGNMSVEELVHRRASVYKQLLDPDFANDPKGFQGTARNTLQGIDRELTKRGEIISNLPQPAAFDPAHVPGSKKRAPYLTQIDDKLDSILPEAKTVVDKTISAPEAVIETTKSGRPIIKVGTAAKTEETAAKTEETAAKTEETAAKTEETAAKTEETAKKTTEKAEETAEKTTLKVGKPIDEIKTKTPLIKVGETAGEIIKDVTEVATAKEKGEEKFYEKGEEKLKEEKEKVVEKLIDAAAEGEKKNARMASAAGRAPVDSPLKRKIVSGLTEITGKPLGRTTTDLLDAADNLSRGVLTAMKDGKNLRLAGTAALLSVAGFALGKKRDRIKKDSFDRMDIDEEQELKRTLMSDG